MIIRVITFNVGRPFQIIYGPDGQLLRKSNGSPGYAYDLLTELGYDVRCYFAGTLGRLYLNSLDGFDSDSGYKEYTGNVPKTYASFMRDWKKRTGATWHGPRQDSKEKS